MAHDSSHPSDDTLKLLIDQDRDGPEVGEVNEILKQCPVCQERLNAIMWERAEHRFGSAKVAAPVLPAGTCLGGRFVIVEPIASGGQGAVYKAFHTDRGGAIRTVAVKVFALGDIDSQAERNYESFRTEILAHANLTHPNIVPIYDFGEHQGQNAAGRRQGLAFYAMELLSAGTLEGQLPATKPEAQARTGVIAFSPEQAAGTVEVLARAMHYVHEKRIVHRDLKPRNVLLAADGTLKLTDFGLAWSLDPGSQARFGPKAGTPSYKAPEQVRGDTERIDSRTDVYGLSAILHALLAGRPPELAKSGVRLSGRRRALEAICRKGLAENPSDRYQTAADLAEDLRRYQRQELTHAWPTHPVWRGMEGTKLWVWHNRGVFATGLVVLAALTAVIVLLTRDVYQRAQHSKELTSALRENYVSAAMSAQDANQQHESLPWLAAALLLPHQTPEEQAVLRLQILTTLRQTPRPIQILPHEGTVDAAVFSPDAERRWVLTSTEHCVRVWDGARGQVYWEQEFPVGVRFAGFFGSTGKKVGTLTGDNCLRLWLVGESKPYWQYQGKPVVTQAWFDAAGEYVAMPLVTPEGPTGRVIEVWEVSRNATWTIPVAKPMAQAAVSPKEPLLAIASGAQVELWELSTQKRRAGGLLPHGTAVTALAFSSDGRWLATGCKDGSVRLWNAANGKEAWPKPASLGASIEFLRFNSDDSVVLAGGEGFSRATGEQVPQDYPLAYELGPGALGPQGRSWLQFDGPLVTIRTQALTPVVATFNHNQTILGAAFSGERVVTIDEGGLARVWNVETGQRLGAPRKVGEAAFLSNDGRCLAEAGGKVVRPNADGGWTDVFVGDPKTFPFKDLALGATGRFLAFVTEDGKGMVYDLRVHPLTPRTLTPRNTQWIAISPREDRVATFGLDEQAPKPLLGQLWDPRDDGWVRTLEGQPGVLKNGEPWLSPKFSANRLIAPAQVQNKAWVWDTGTGKVVAELPHLRVRQAALNAAGNRAVTLGTEGRDLNEITTVKLWTIDVAPRLLRSLEYRIGINDLAISPDGRLVALAADDGKVEVLAAASGDGLGLPFLLEKPGGVQFDASGMRLLAVSEKNSQVVVWNVADDPAWEDADLAEMAELVAGQTARSGRVLPLEPGATLTRWDGLRQRHPEAFRP